MLQFDYSTTYMRQQRNNKINSLKNENNYFYSN